MLLCVSSSSSAPSCQQQQQQPQSSGRERRVNDPRLRLGRVDEPPETSLSPPASPPPQQPAAAAAAELEVDGLSRQVLYVLRRISMSAARPPSIPDHVSADELKRRNDPRLLHYRSSFHAGMPPGADPLPAVAAKPHGSPAPPPPPPPHFTLPDIVLPPVALPLPSPTAAKPPESSPLPADQKPAGFSAAAAAVRMPEALEEPVPASGEVATATRRPAAGVDTPPPSSSRERKPVVVVDYRNDPRYKKKKTRGASKDDDAVFAAKSDSSVASGQQVREEHVDDTTQLMRSGSHRDDVPPAPQPRFSGGVGNPRVSAEPGMDSEVTPPPVVYSASSQQLSASFLLAANCDVADPAAAAAASPHQVSLKDMFKTIDPTTSPFC